MRHYHTSRLSAKLAAHEAEVLDGAERAAAALDGAIVAAWRQVHEVLKTHKGPGDAFRKMKQVLQGMKQSLQLLHRGNLIGVFLYGYQEAGNAAVAALPEWILQRPLLEDE